MASLAALGVEPETVMVSAVVDAASGGHAEIIKLLAPVSNISAYGHLALRLAAHQGHLSCAQLLLPPLGSTISEAESLQFSAALASAACNGHLECLHAILPFADPSFDNNAPISYAAEHGHAECVLALLPLVGSPEDTSRALCAAVSNQRSACVDLLAPSATLAAFNQAASIAVQSESASAVAGLLAARRRGQGSALLDSQPLSLAALLGNVDVIELIIPISDPKALDSIALRNAAENGRVECVKILLPHSDPLAQNSAALGEAISAGHVECARLLLPFSNVEDLPIEVFERAILWDYSDALSEAILAMSDKGLSLPLGRLVATAIEEGSLKCLNLLLLGLPCSPFSSNASAQPPLDDANFDASNRFSLGAMMEFLDKAKSLPARSPDMEAMLTALVERLVLGEAPRSVANAPKHARPRAL